MAAHRHVINRKGLLEPVSFDRITTRLTQLDTGLEVDATLIAQKTIERLSDHIQTSELDIIAANAAEQMKTTHPHYTKFAARILISNMHKNTPATFSACMRKIMEINPHRLSETFLRFVELHAAELDAMIDHMYDEKLNYFGAKILERTYLITVRDAKLKTEFTCDRPQYLYLRVAIAIYMDDGTLDNIHKCYKLLASHAYTQATPTLLNAGTTHQQFGSCFLLGVNDNQPSIMNAAKDLSEISVSGGGVGYCVDEIRASGTYLARTGGFASGTGPQLKIVEACARCWNQGGRRPGAIAVFMSMWHGDIQHFLEMKLTQGEEANRARDLFYGVWVPDLFMRRCNAADARAAEAHAAATMRPPDGSTEFTANEVKDWSLFSVLNAPFLPEVYDGMEICACGYSPCPAFRALQRSEHRLHIDGVDDTQSRTHMHTHNYKRINVFTQLYEKYEAEDRACARVSCLKLRSMIFTAQRESGTPYVCFKDHINRQSNQRGIGTVRASNLCTEIMEVADGNSYATCTLASFSLPHYVNVNNGVPNTTSYIDALNISKLHDDVQFIVRTLARIIKINSYPVDKCINNTKKFRPIGIGIQGLADVFAMLRIPFVSEAAAAIDYLFMETIYHAALTASCALAEETGEVFADYMDSPAAEGKLRPDLWLENAAYRETDLGGVPYSGRWDWAPLRANIAKYGLYHSLHVALMPTVSTSQVLGNNESFEPFPANIYTKNTVVGKFVVSNAYMIQHLIELGLWTDKLREHVINTGSIADIKRIPQEVRDIYKTVWEIKQSELVRRAARRNAFIDQAQSLNIHVQNNSPVYLQRVFITGWNMGLCTGSYYIRSQPAASAMKNNQIASTPLAVTAGASSSTATVTATATATATDDSCPIGCDNCSS